MPDSTSSRKDKYVSMQMKFAFHKKKKIHKQQPHALPFQKSPLKPYSSGLKNKHPVTQKQVAEVSRWDFQN